MATSSGTRLIGSVSSVVLREAHGQSTERYLTQATNPATVQLQSVPADWELLGHLPTLAASAAACRLLFKRSHA